MDISSFLTLKGKVEGDLEIKGIPSCWPVFLSPAPNSKQDCMYGIRGEERLGSLYQ